MSNEKSKGILGIVVTLLGYILAAAQAIYNAM